MMRKIFALCAPRILLCVCCAGFCPYFVVLLALTGARNAFAQADPITGAEPAEGFGANATGGYGRPEVIVTTFAELQAAVSQNNVYIRVQGEIVATDNCFGSGSNITIDGGGAATIRGTASPTSRGQRQLELYGTNIVIKDIRLRESGDNLSFKKPAQNILISHVSTTGAYDDGMSIAYGTKNVTVQYCVFFGCTRSCFMTTQRVTDMTENISLHHNWFKGQWIRGPLVDAVMNTDVRNQINEDWWLWGGPRFQEGATGNCINCVFVMTGVTPGKTDAADYTYQGGGPAYFSGSIYRDCSGRPDNSPTEIPCAPVTTQSAAEAEVNVRANAGCLPRDELDLAYIAATSWPEVDDTHPWIASIPATTEHWTIYR